MSVLLLFCFFFETVLIFLENLADECCKNEVSHRVALEILYTMVLYIVVPLAILGLKEIVERLKTG